MLEQLDEEYEKRTRQLNKLSRQRSAGNLSPVQLQSLHSTLPPFLYASVSPTIVRLALAPLAAPQAKAKMLIAVERRLRELEALRSKVTQPRPMPLPTIRGEDLNNKPNKLSESDGDVMPSDGGMKTAKPTAPTASIPAKHAVSAAAPVSSIGPIKAIATIKPMSPTEALKPSDMLLQMRRMRTMLTKGGGGGAFVQEPSAAGVLGSAVTVHAIQTVAPPAHDHGHDKMSLMQQVANLQKA